MLCVEKFCNLASSGSAHIAFHDKLISRETVNSEGDRADLEGQRLLQLYRHAVQTSIALPLVAISYPDLRAPVWAPD